MAKKPAAGKSETPPKGRKGLFIALAVTLLLLGGGGAGAYFWLSPGPAAEEHVAEPEATAGEGEADEEGPLEARAIVEFEPFIVNLADADASRFVKASISLAVTEEGLPAEIEENPVIGARLRSSILELLSERSAAEITSADGKDALRMAIREEADAILPEGRVAEVLFTDFIVQF